MLEKVLLTNEQKRNREQLQSYFDNIEMDWFHNQEFKEWSIVKRIRSGQIEWTKRDLKAWKFSHIEIEETLEDRDLHAQNLMSLIKTFKENGFDTMTISNLPSN